MDFRLETIDGQHVAGIHEARMSDLQLLADHCANMRAAGMTGSKDFKMAASVPPFFVQKYINDNGITFAEFQRDNAHIDRFLSDPALKAFRVWEGRI